MRMVRCWPGANTYSAVSSAGTSNATDTVSAVSRRTSATRSGWKTGIGVVRSVLLEVVERLAARRAAPQRLARCRPEAGQLLDLRGAAAGTALRPAAVGHRQQPAAGRCDAEPPELVSAGLGHPVGGPCRRQLGAHLDDVVRRLQRGADVARDDLGRGAAGGGRRQGDPRAAALPGLARGPGG